MLPALPPYLEVHDPRREVAMHAIAGAIYRLGPHPDQGRSGRSDGRPERPPVQAPPLGVHAREEESQLVIDVLV